MTVEIAPKGAGASFRVELSQRRKRHKAALRAESPTGVDQALDGPVPTPRGVPGTRVEGLQPKLQLFRDIEGARGQARRTRAERPIVRGFFSTPAPPRLRLTQRRAG